MPVVIIHQVDAVIHKLKTVQCLWTSLKCYNV